MDTNHGKRSERVGQHVIIHLWQDSAAATDEFKGGFGLDDGTVGTTVRAQDILRLLLDDLLLCLIMLDDGGRFVD